MAEEPVFTLYSTGSGLLEAKLRAISEAQFFIRMETYIYCDEEIGRRFREALISAARRGVWVYLLVDAVGGMDLPKEYFHELASQPKAVMRWFNQPSLATWSFRDHRKLLVIDGQATFVGGCNIAQVYAGDGVYEGWRDGGLRIDHPELAREMEVEFDDQFASAESRQWQVQVKRTVKPAAKGTKPVNERDIAPLFIRPGFGQSPLRDAVRRDLQGAKRVCITSAYFLPTRGLRRQLGAAVARGAELRLLIGGKSDVKMMQLATRSLYPQLLDARIRIFEYQPQVLHAKGLIIDDVVYAGSSNLDPRSLRINFEVMVRIHSKALAEQMRHVFERDLRQSVEVTEQTLEQSSFIVRLKQSLCRWLLARVDPRMSEGMLRRLQFRP
jgi:cardiolipin synthase